MNMKREIIQNEVNIILNYFNSGKFDVAIARGQKLIKKYPDILAIYNLVGLAFHNKGDYSNAILFYNSALKKNPDFYSSLNNLGNSYKELSNYQEAEVCYLKALKINPKYNLCLSNLGSLYKDLNNTEKAITFYKKSLEIKETDTTYFDLSFVYLSIGDVEKAKECLNKVIKLNPNFVKANTELLDIVNSKEKTIYVEQLNQLLNDNKINTNEKSIIYFSLGKYNEKIKKYDLALDYFKKANYLKKSLIKDKSKKYFDRIKSIKNLFLNLDFNQYKESGNKDEKILFVLGLPRSGTTLIEQILSAHHNVYAAGELEDLGKIISKNFSDKNDSILFSKTIDSYNKNIFNEMGSKYLSNIERFKQNKKYLTDKSVANFQWIGFIKLILPNSKIIHCSRNFKDNFLSLFTNYFDSGLDWSYDTNDIHEYYKLYLDLVQFWKSSIPNFIYDVQYEEIIEDPKNEIKKLLNFCNLEWNDSCLNFYKNKRPIYTASNKQANQPLYKTSIDKWKIYEKLIPELFKI